MSTKAKGGYWPARIRGGRGVVVPLTRVTGARCGVREAVARFYRTGECVGVFASYPAAREYLKARGTR